MHGTEVSDKDWPHMVYVKMSSEDLIEGFKAGLAVELNGRIISVRRMKNVFFADVGDVVGHIQISCEGIQDIGVGDWISVKGSTGYSEAGEPTVFVNRLNIEAKCHIEIPYKTGLCSSKRYGCRHLDLMTRPELRRFLQEASRFSFALKRLLVDRGFLEFDTGTVQQEFNAGISQPFKTYTNATKSDCYLRITSEFRLKQLLASGFERVFEFGKSYRNGKAGKIYQPEFTLPEFYALYMDLEDMIQLEEEIICNALLETFGTLDFITHDGVISFKRPWPRIYLKDAFRQATGETFDFDIRNEKDLSEEMARISPEHKLPEGLILSQMYNNIIGGVIFKKIKQPTFVVGYPHASSPFAKINPKNGLAQRAYLIINGISLSDLTEDENDIGEIRRRLADPIFSAGRQASEAFLHALECGIPRSAGASLSLERLLSILAGRIIDNNIREIILFPL